MIKKIRSQKKRQWKCQQNKKQGISKAKYPAALRSFAMTLHFYSPKAYEFVRQKFCKALPDPNTLRSWYSSIDGTPGFTFESFEALKKKVVASKKSNKKVLVTFMLDEISIKKSLQRLPNGKICGYVDFGSEMESNDTIPLTKDALVMMVVSLDESWKIPLGYFLINGIDSATNSGLIREALIRLHEIEVEVVSLTLDGPSEHFATMRALGASFDLLNLKPFFPHPSTQEKIHIIFYACHMLKLVRNTLGDLKILKDAEGNSIEWRFIEALAQLQKKEGLRAGNKLKMAHIHYWKMKMKVALAAQTLSDSVADSIEFCDKYLNLVEFKGSEATVKFIRCINRIFDFLNSRNFFAKGFKAPLTKFNEEF
ncbi:thap domain-containing protein 9-like protein [Lasius niger]|uniref:Thap domain-containing protein 9-like protein n=1 Tax=Lasius niger TaxID=67767 RepID=A0A0J7K406_LASNI|nr:thap domain-containing protein 9-like protein [Lasius niger]